MSFTRVAYRSTGERPFTGAWVRGHSQEHGQAISGYSTEEDVSLSRMLASGNTQSRLAGPSGGCVQQLVFVPVTVIRDKSTYEDEKVVLAHNFGGF